MIELNEKIFEEEIKKYKLILVDFWAPWCIPCKLLEPTLVILENDICIGKVNIDKDIELAKKFYIRSVPTLIIFNNGKIVQRYIGVQHVSTIKGFISSFEKHKNN